MPILLKKETLAVRTQSLAKQAQQANDVGPFGTISVTCLPSKSLKETGYVPLGERVPGAASGPGTGVGGLGKAACGLGLSTCITSFVRAHPG